MVGLNESKVFEKLKHFNFKYFCSKVSAAPFIISLDSNNEITLNVSLEGDETHTLTVTLNPPGSVIF